MGYLKLKLENDKIFKNGSFPDMHSEVFTDFNKIQGVKNNFSVRDNIVKQTTVECILSYAENYNVLALNFANAMYAGGGYVLGGNAQEESLCRSSLLYYTIKYQKEYYWRNRLHILPDYTSTLIYSQNVPLIRDGMGNLLEIINNEFLHNHNYLLLLTNKALYFVFKKSAPFINILKK